MKKIILFVLLAVVIGGYFSRDVIEQKFFQQPWYAVHLTNDQVYFGHITSLSDTTLTLSDAYYLESVPSSPVSKSADFMLQRETQPTYKLTERGNDTELTSDHKVFINRTAVLFWEKLLDTSDVVQLIKKGS